MNLIDGSRGLMYSFSYHHLYVDPELEIPSIRDILFLHVLGNSIITAPFLRIILYS